MKTRHPVLCFVYIALLLLGGTGLLLRVQQRQYALNRQLIDALVKGDTQTALALVNEGADPNTPCLPPPVPSLQFLFDHLLHRTPLTKVSPTAFLLVCCVQWNPQNGSCLPNPLICFQDNTPLLEAMRAHGANLEARTSDHYTALHYAARVSSGFRTMQWLLQHGVDVDGSEEVGNTLLMTADLAQARLLLAHHANPNAQTEQGNAPLHFAVYGASGETNEYTQHLVSLLLTYGADPNLPNKKGETPLLLAQKMKRPDLVALMKHGKKKP